ncbi:hypothetical protein D3C85_1162240 [compost metagenome]
MPVRHFKQFGILLGDTVGAGITLRASTAIHQFLIAQTEVDHDIPLAREDSVSSFSRSSTGVIELRKVPEPDHRTVILVMDIDRVVLSVDFCRVCEHRLRLRAVVIDNKLFGLDRAFIDDAIEEAEMLVQADIRARVESVFKPLRFGHFQKVVQQHDMLHLDLRKIQGAFAGEHNAEVDPRLFPVRQPRL